MKYGVSKRVLVRRKSKPLGMGKTGPGSMNELFRGCRERGFTWTERETVSLFGRRLKVHNQPKTCLLITMKEGRRDFFLSSSASVISVVFQLGPKVTKLRRAWCPTEPYSHYNSLRPPCAGNTRPSAGAGGRPQGATSPSPTSARSPGRRPPRAGKVEVEEGEEAARAGSVPSSTWRTASPRRSSPSSSISSSER